MRDTAKNMKGRVYPVILMIFAVISFGSAAKIMAQVDPAEYVNPFIGTAGQEKTKNGWRNGETFPGAVVPWGMVSVSPHTALGSKSGYLYGQPYLYGFGHVHLSGVGCRDLGNIVLMPTVGKIETTPQTYKSGYRDEKASPGYYKTTLEPSGIVAEMTATTHTGISKYTFPERKGDANILIDASITENFHMMPALGHIKIISKREVAGWTESGHFCGAPEQTQKVYFFAEFSSPAVREGTWINNRVSTQKQQSGRGVGAYFRFNTSRDEAICVKVGISYVSIADARLNLKTEQPGWDFGKVRAEARALWNYYLGRFRVEGGTKAQKVMFYTGLYHMLIHPSVFSDVNGDYLTMGHDGVAKANGYTHYDVYSLWDTYRAEHVFLTLFYPEKEHDMVESLLAMYKESGWLPKWELAGEDTHVMNGDPAINVLAETYINGVHNFDIGLAYKAMKHNATDTVNNPVRPDIKKYLAYHYLPVGVRGSVSATLEDNMADYSLARMAHILGHPKDYLKFKARSEYFKNLYDSSTGFLRPRNADGTWYKPFYPYKFKSEGFIEGSAWNYLFYVPFDETGLAKLMGGQKQYVRKLQESFNRHKFMLINEPDIAYPYLFTYFKGESWRTQKAVREGMKNKYNANPDGIPGNDDCGALSAWYVFSAMGFYPANPVSGKFRLGSPVFKKVTIRLNHDYYAGSEWVIKAAGASEHNIFVKSVKLNDKPYNKSYITNSDIENGGSIDFVMSATH